MRSRSVPRNAVTRRSNRETTVPAEAEAEPPVAEPAEAEPAVAMPAEAEPAKLSLRKRKLPGKGSIKKEEPRWAPLSAE